MQSLGWRVHESSREIPIYRHHGNKFLTFLAAFLGVIVVFLLIGAADVAFQRIGLTRLQVVLVLVATFVGSYVNLPLFRVKSLERIMKVEEVRFFWVTYRIPRISVEEVSTLLAVNLGGAIIPLSVSVYLLYSHLDLIASALLATILTAIVVHLVARKVPGLGIATPAFIPPLAAALSAYAFAPGAPNVVAYVCGTLGTLIGADLTNLHGIEELGAPVVSVGGAGTFDGVFLSGIIASLLV